MGRGRTGVTGGSLWTNRKNYAQSRRAAILRQVGPTGTRMQSAPVAAPQSYHTARGRIVLMHLL